jgi:hypothetical protein
LQQLLKNAFPFPVLTLSPSVTFKTHGIQIIRAVIPEFQRPGSSVYSYNSTKQQLFRQPVILHPCNVTKPSQAPVLEQSSNVGHSTPVYHTITGNQVSPRDTTDTTEAFELKHLESVNH